VHLDLQICWRIFEKIKIALRELAGGQRKVKTEKNSEEKKKIS
jgi:hypothetical protein